MQAANEPTVDLWNLKFNVGDSWHDGASYHTTIKLKNVNDALNAFSGGRGKFMMRIFNRGNRL